MSGIGADLPPHLLAKRKRQEEEAESDAPTTASGAKRPSSPDEPEKRRKVLGPAMPPAPLDERPTAPPDAEDEDSSDDDDDFGPSLPTEGAVTEGLNEDEENGIEAEAPAQQQLKRDDWMMMPPTQDDLAARLDPTKQRPKAFNTGKGARGPNTAGEDSSTWHETPEQKQKRLQDEMMGISKASAPAKSGSTKSSKVKDDATKHKIQEHDKIRGPSLMEHHKATKGPEVDDDPSKRAFDKEKDMASGAQFSSTQKKEMLQKASNFSGKFSGGTYL
ncbi:hypothetical protein M409DRAFT_25437 [Zasmidium cellare ATCC 36951]|uniref:DUF3752 domain-containing protein n=1 Tax=Zasmidium cellare ATCC 36951 TaxID=1080233 RepID=A0A6A6CD11_ZASCE|nr:uncharacterized protein M409DRAFT_25437 [Zasmidium cellare ATCC 36951]KAF2164090.1 hypothetical protein M409DRAFT_25437 [Zasmidium cellare ATCC 36951]